MFLVRHLMSDFRALHLWYVLLAGLLCGCLTANARLAHAAEIHTLEQALDIALQENRLLENASMEVDKAADSVAAEKTRRLPRLDVRLSESYNLTKQSYTCDAGTFGIVPTREIKIESQDDFTTVVSASVKQPLSELYRINLSIDQQEVMGGIADWQLRSRRQSVVKDVKKACYDILKTQNSLISTKESIVFYREIDQLVKRYLEEQTVLKYQVMELTRARRVLNTRLSASVMSWKRHRKNSTSYSVLM